MKNWSSLTILLCLVIIATHCIDHTEQYPSRPPKIPQVYSEIPIVYSRYRQKNHYHGVDYIGKVSYRYGLYSAWSFLQFTMLCDTKFTFKVEREEDNPTDHRLPYGNKVLSGYFKLRIDKNARPDFFSDILFNFRTEDKRRPDDIVGMAVYNRTGGSWILLNTVEESPNTIRGSLNKTFIQSFFRPGVSDDSDIWLTFPSGIGREGESAASSLIASSVLIMMSIVGTLLMTFAL